MQEAENIDIKKYVTIIFRRKYVFIAVFLIVLSVIVWGSFFMPEMYKARSKVFIEESAIKKLIDGVNSRVLSEKDILLSGITGPLPRPGDYLQIDNAGAYTMVMTPPFINPAPAILALEEGYYKVIRTRQTLDGILYDYRIDPNEASHES